MVLAWPTRVLAEFARPNSVSDRAPFTTNCGRPYSTQRSVGVGYWLVLHSVKRTLKLPHFESFGRLRHRNLGVGLS